MQKEIQEMFNLPKSAKCGNCRWKKNDKLTICKDRDNNELCKFWEREYKQLTIYDLLGGDMFG